MLAIIKSFKIQNSANLLHQCYVGVFDWQWPGNISKQRLKCHQIQIQILLNSD